MIAKIIFNKDGDNFNTLLYDEKMKIKEPYIQYNNNIHDEDNDDDDDDDDDDIKMNLPTQLFIGGLSVVGLYILFRNYFKK